MKELDDQIVNRLMHKHNIKPSEEQVLALVEHLIPILMSIEDAEDRIKKARRARENFYNEEAYKVTGSQVNSTKR